MAKSYTIANLIAEVGEPLPDFEGWVTNDDFVLAIGITGEETSEKEYEVVQTGMQGLDAQLNPVTQDKQYIRAGQSTTKTGTQRTFAASGDRYIGDGAMDFIMSHKVKYGTGNAVVVPYVYFCLLNGKGEKGTVSVIVNSDGGGNAGESAAISVDFKKVGAMPTEYTYSAV